MNIRKTPLWLVFALLFLGSLGAWLFHRYYTAASILARHGVYFNDDATAFEHLSVQEARFWFDGPAGRLSGPSLVGDAPLSVEQPYQTADGQLEFVVQTSDRRVRIQLLSPPQGDAAFRVVDADPKNLNPHYTPERIQKAP